MENKILAVVNGLEISQKDLDETIKRFPEDRRAYIDTDLGRKQLLEQIISFELMYNYGKELNLESEQEFLIQVERMKKELLTQMSINKVLSEVTVNEEEVENYYKTNKELFKEGESVKAKHILVDTFEECDNIASEIKAGLNFEEAAQKYSKCPSNANGGDLGTFTRGRMVPEFEEAAFKLNIGEISEPVKTQFGYHLIKVEEKNEASVKSFDEVKDLIWNNLLQEKQNKKYLDKTEELKKKYQVQYNK